MRKVRLALSDLLTFDGWNATAKKYLQTVVEAVDIQQAATEYRDKVMAFYQWVQARQDEIHANEIKRFRAKEAELQLLKVVDRIDSYFAFAPYPQSPNHEVFLRTFPPTDIT